MALSRPFKTDRRPLACLSSRQLGGSVLTLVVYPRQVVSQAPRHFRPFEETQATAYIFYSSLLQGTSSVVVLASVPASSSQAPQHFSLSEKTRAVCVMMFCMLCPPFYMLGYIPFPFCLFAGTVVVIAFSSHA